MKRTRKQLGALTTAVIYILPFFLLILAVQDWIQLSPTNPVPTIQPPLGHTLAKIPAATEQMIVESYGRLPLSFEANQGQTDRRVRFLSRGSGYTLFLTSDEAVLSLHRSPSGNASSTAIDVVRLQLIGGNPSPEVVGMNEQPNRSHYFVGNHPKHWRTNISHYGKVHYQQVYPGVDLIYYGNQRRLEYDFVVAPEVDPNVIRLGFQGADRLNLDEKGNLILHTAGGEILLHAPIVYQEIEGTRQMITARHVLQDNSQVGFQVAAYDASRPLIIDPVLSYATYLGGSGEDFECSVAVDGLGNVYVAGYTASSDFPTESPFYGTNGGGRDAFVAKLNATGSDLIYSTYLGGSGGDYGYAIAVDGLGNAYVAGQTASPNFPTKNPLYPTLGGSIDAFVAKLNATGSDLIYSTYLGGSGEDVSYAIAVDRLGNAYVTGHAFSSNFPMVNALYDSHNGISDAFVAKLNAAGSALIYSTYLGGSDYDFSYAIAVDGAGNAYVTGSIASSNFPTANALDDSHNGGRDVFVAKLNAAGSDLSYSSYLGGTGSEWGNAIAVDGAGNAYVTGYTLSSDFPTANALYGSHNGSRDAFVVKLNETGSALVYATYLGGSDMDAGSGIALDGADNAYIAGYTASSNFPTVNALDDSHNGSRDAFVAKLDATGSNLVYSTYLGGSDFDLSKAIAVDGAGNAYVTGYTASSNLPTQSPLDATLGGISDAFVAKLGQANRLPVARCKNAVLDLDASGQAALDPSAVDDNSFDPDGGPITLSLDKTVFTCADLGDQTVTLIVTDDREASASCQATVTVIDITPPTIAIDSPEKGVTFLSKDQVDVGYTVSDACDPSLAITVSPGDPIGPPLDVGELEITVEATDVSGNEGIVSVTVSVEPIHAEFNFDPNTLNKSNSNGAVTGYIELPEGCGTCEDIDLSSILLKGPTGSVMPITDPKSGFVKSPSSYCVDSDGDGISERLVKFQRADVVEIVEYPTSRLTVGGELLASSPFGTAAFEGSDEIRVIEKGKAGKSKTKNRAKKSALVFGVENFPNPANPSTTIRYTLPEATDVRLVIYNLLGQEVRVLVNSGQGTGTHSVHWDGRDTSGRVVTTGVYLYHLQAGPNVAVKKMVFTK